MKTIHLKPGKHHRIAAGHRWAFAGEITESLKSIEPGEAVALCDARGRLLGRGYAHPHTLIAVRLITRGDELWDEGLFHRRVQAALDHRRRWMPGAEMFRLIYAESDQLPGLIVDHYAGHLVVQSLTMGIESRLGEITSALVQVVQPKSILLKGTGPFRILEGLGEDTRPLFGEPPDEISVASDGLTFTVRPTLGQKTGSYLDQRNNRQLLAQLIRTGAGFDRVLDLFSYTGAWGLSALAAGAGEAVMVDSSSKAIEWGMADAVRNGLQADAWFVQADVGEFLAQAGRRGDKWDVVILDPPALIPSKSSLKTGMRAYRTLIQAALKVVRMGGLLVTCSCSHHLSRELHSAIIGEAAARAGRHLQLIAFGGHGPDHPILPGHPETEYLKVGYFVCN